MVILTDGDQNKTLIKKKRPSIRETQKYKILLVPIINNIYYRKGTGQKPKKDITRACADQ